MNDDRVATIRRSMAGRWSCARKDCSGPKQHVELRTRLIVKTGRIVESFRYACGHISERVVGELMPDSVFDAIERRVASCT